MDRIKALVSFIYEGVAVEKGEVIDVSDSPLHIDWLWLRNMIPSRYEVTTDPVGKPETPPGQDEPDATLTGSVFDMFITEYDDAGEIEVIDDTADSSLFVLNDAGVASGVLQPVVQLRNMYRIASLVPITIRVLRGVVSIVVIS